MTIMFFYRTIRIIHSLLRNFRRNFPAYPKQIRDMLQQKFGDDYAVTVLFYLYIFVMFTFGFWVNFTHFSLFIDIFALALFFAFLKTRKWKISVPLELKSLCILLAVFLFGGMLIAIFCCYSVKMSILGYRDYCEFIVMSFIVLNFIDSPEKAKKVIVFMAVMGFAVSLFGIFQSLLADKLPDLLLHMRSDVIDYVDGSHGKIYRCNGLFENCIVYNGVLIISFAVSFGLLLSEKENRLRYLIFSAVILLANFLTFSRTAIAGIFLVALIEYLMLFPGKMRVKIMGILLLALVAALILVIFFSDSVMFRRFFDSKMESNMISNFLHFAAIKDALGVIGDNFFAGVGMGTQAYDSGGSTINYVLDGMWWQYCLELGVPLTVLFLAILVLLIKKAKDIFGNGKMLIGYRNLAAVIISVTVYFILSGFINSSFNAKSVFGLYWVLIGILMSAYRMGERHE